jgi:hypothetical protein
MYTVMGVERISPCIAGSPPSYLIGDQKDVYLPPYSKSGIVANGAVENFILPQYYDWQQLTDIILDGPLSHKILIS